MTEDKIGSIAADVATRSFIAYANRHKLRIDDSYRAADLVRSHAVSAVPQALADARQAVEANMMDAATATFKASFAVAGIAAAKEYFGHS